MVFKSTPSTVIQACNELPDRANGKPDEKPKMVKAPMRLLINFLKEAFIKSSPILGKGLISCLKYINPARNEFKRDKKLNKIKDFTDKVDKLKQNF